MLQRVIDELALGEAGKVLETGWEASQTSLPEGVLPFLTSEFVARACREASIPDEIADVATAAAGRIGAQPAARALVWHLHCSLHLDPPYPRDPIRRWPLLDGALGGEDGRMLYLLGLLSGLPVIEAYNAAHGVPLEIARHTLSDITRWLGGDEDGPIKRPWGISPTAVSWLTNHMRGELYRLGRLQFQFGSFHEDARVYRRRTTGEVTALSEDGVSYRADGGCVTEGVETGPDQWKSRLSETAQGMTGNPISPDGRALREEVTLDAAEWEQVLVSGLPTLHIHIPAGGPMAHDECGESFRRAMEFFPKHFPERPSTAFDCGSWLLDSELQGFLPETSNIVRFQREFYLLPVDLTPRYVLGNIFDGEAKDLSKAPRRTGLQRAVLAAIEAGRPLRPTGGACFLLMDDLDWGKQVYLRRG